MVEEGIMVSSWASEELRNKKQFILKCVKAKDVSAWVECSGRLQDDRDVMRAYQEKFGLHFEYLSDKHRDDPEIAMAAIAKDPPNLKYCSQRLQADRQVIMAAVKSDKAVFKYTYKEFKRDPAIVLTAFISTFKAAELAHSSTLKALVKRGATDLEEPSKRQNTA